MGWVLSVHFCGGVWLCWLQSQLEIFPSPAFPLPWTHLRTRLLPGQEAMGGISDWIGLGTTWKLSLSMAGEWEVDL